MVTCGRTTNSGAVLDEGDPRTRLAGNCEAQLNCWLPAPQKLGEGKESRGCMQSWGCIGCRRSQKNWSVGSCVPSAFLRTSYHQAGGNLGGWAESALPRAVAVAETGTTLPETPKVLRAAD